MTNQHPQRVLSPHISRVVTNQHPQRVLSPHISRVVTNQHPQRVLSPHISRVVTNQHPQRVLSPHISRVVTNQHPQRVLSPHISRVVTNQHPQRVLSPHVSRVVTNQHPQRVLPFVFSVTSNVLLLPYLLTRRMLWPPPLPSRRRFRVRRNEQESPNGKKISRTTVHPESRRLEEYLNFSELGAGKPGVSEWPTSIGVLGFSLGSPTVSWQQASALHFSVKLRSQGSV